MTKRKIFLICANLILLVVFIIQVIAGSKNNVKNFVAKETPDEFVINNAGESYTIVLENGKWFVGEKKYPASRTSVEPLVNTIVSITALDKVGQANNQSSLDRYELNDNQKISVVAKKNGIELRTLNIGKSVTAGSQCYATIDDSKDVYILAGRVRSVFNKTVADLRSNAILDLEKPLITSVTLNVEGKTPWTVSRSGAAEDFVCYISGSDIELDNQKANNYLDSLSALTTNIWYNEGEDLGGKKTLTAEITYDSRKIILNVFELPPEDDSDLIDYYGTSSETPYTFNLGNYSVNRFLISPEELAK